LKRKARATNSILIRRPRAIEHGSDYGVNPLGSGYFPNRWGKFHTGRAHPQIQNLSLTSLTSSACKLQHATTQIQ
jgi:hypothetical protein